MSKREYAIEIGNETKIAKAILSNQPISLKYSIEISREIRGQPLNKAAKFLLDVLEHKRHVPIRRFRAEMAHRKGRAVSFTKTGKYPERASKVFLGLLDQVKANADYKGLDAEKLLIKHIAANQGYRKTSYQSRGRISGKKRRKKSTHLEIVVQEMK
ncbi:MAG: 50S ribosomal protein L22 [archaeon]|nr:50S ribosomal protein L22 [archaeon]